MLSLLLLCVACGDDDVLPDTGMDAFVPDVGRDVGVDAGRDASVDAGEDAGEDAGPPDAGPPDPCTRGALCDDFDGYGDRTALANGDRFGPWRAALGGEGSTFDLDTTRATSGDTALHVRIADGQTNGGRLFTTDDVPVLEGGPTELYGRMMMYVGDNGHSVHWTLAGVSGPTLAGSPVEGRRSTYLFSSLRQSDANQFSAVNYINTDPAQDCWNRSDTPIPSGEWMCLEWSVDSEGRHIRMSKDGEPLIAVDETGQGCVGDVANDSPWHGPAIDQFYVGTWSFHPMTGPLEVWIDDVVVDTSPLACP